VCQKLYGEESRKKEGGGKEEKRGKIIDYQFPHLVLPEPVNDHLAHVARPVDGVIKLIRHSVHLTVSVSGNLSLGLQLFYIVS
jgi:hypothetical protein